MFPDRTIAEKFCSHKDKCAYFINCGIAPHFRSVLTNNIKDSLFYAISFDESLNTVIQMGQMDLVNFWDNVFNKVCKCYLDSTFIRHAQHQHLFEHFVAALDSLDLKKLLQVSVDGPNVSWAFFSELRNYETENDMSKLLSTGSCNLHAIHGAFKTGEQSTYWKLKKFWEHYIKFCTTRQLGEMIMLIWPEVVNSRFHFAARRGSDGQLAVQAIEIWDDICHLCRFWQSLPKSKWPPTQSYLTLLSATKGPLILAKLHFLYISFLTI